MGAVILPLIALYLAFLVWATWRGWRWAETRGWKGHKRWLGAACGFLIVYLPVFWDWLPTVVAHKYYCDKEAGFWVYKTVEQWKAENPGVMEGLHLILEPNQRTTYGDLNILDERFAIETRRHHPVPFLTTSVTDRTLVDRKTGEALAKGTDVGSGVGYMATGGGFKFWLNQRPCLVDGISSFSKELQKMRGKK
jgi:hypothetical protein